MSKKPQNGPAQNGPDRRNLLKAIGLGSVGLAGGLGIGQAQAADLPRPERSESADVVVIGGGMAGCAAALQAAEAGASVILVEKASRLGGNSILAAGTFSLPLEDNADARQAYVEDYFNITQERGDRGTFEAMARDIAENIAWLEGHGAEFLAAEERPPNRVATRNVGPGAWVGMPAFFRLLGERIEAHGGRILTDVKARQLLVDERGAVAGLRAQDEDGLIDYRARAVIIAAGGYAANTAMLEAFSDPNAGALMVRGYRGATGDGHLIAQAAGAGLVRMGGMMALHIAAVSPESTAAGQPARAIPYALSINREGRRFIDESRGYVAHGKAVLDQPEGLTTLVFDQTIRDLGPVSGVLNTFDRLGLDIYSADTIEELAEKVGLPPQTTRETIEAFNAEVSDGEAPGAEPPKRTLAYPVETGPFYALHPLVPGITLTFGGIMTDDEARVLEPDGRPIPGLYAAGEGAGGAFFEDYIGGGALSMCLTMGRIAGRSATG
ncbi:MAG: FAD-dependent oxidoreductase [Salinarimonas sp.]